MLAFRLKSQLYWKIYDDFTSELHKAIEDQQHTEEEMREIQRDINKLREEVAELEHRNKIRKKEVEDQIVNKSAEKEVFEKSLKDELIPKYQAEKISLKKYIFS